MDAHFCSQICSFLDVLNNITDDLCGYQGYVNIAWMLIFFEIFLKKMCSDLAGSDFKQWRRKQR